MASIFPIQINNLRFYVNPTQLSITKPLTYATLPTTSGIIYQIWYDSPETLSVTGASAGGTAYNELVFLRQNFENINKVVSIFYKTQLYQGFITNLSVTTDIMGHPNRFNYSIQIQLLQGQKFAIEDFAITSQNQGIISGAINSATNFINQKLGLNNVQASLTKFVSKI